MQVGYSIIIIGSCICLSYPCLHKIEMWPRKFISMSMLAMANMTKIWICLVLSLTRWPCGKTVGYHSGGSGSNMDPIPSVLQEGFGPGLLNSILQPSGLPCYGCWPALMGSTSGCCQLKYIPCVIWQLNYTNLTLTLS